MNDDELGLEMVVVFWEGSLSRNFFDSSSKLCKPRSAECELEQSHWAMVL